MERRITGSLVNKGDLVVSRQLYFNFNSTFPWVAEKYSDLDGYRRNMRNMAKNGLGVVIKTISKYDRSITGNDCSVFWSKTQTVTQESSQCLKVLSPVDVSNS